MQLTFYKQLDVQAAVGYLKIEQHTKREDIRQYLVNLRDKGYGYENKTLEERVKTYLEQIRLLHRGTITPEGEETIKTGCVYQREEGKYQFWYCFDWLNDKQKCTIIDLQRLDVQRDNNSSMAELPSSIFAKEHYLLPIGDRQDVEKIRLLAGQSNYYVEEKMDKSKINLVWQWDWDKQKSYFYYEKTGKNDLLSHKIERTIGNITTYLNNWESTYNRLKCAWRDVPEEARKSFIITKKYTTQNIPFDKIEITDLPLMPANINDSTQWRDWLVVEGMSKDYITEDQWRKLFGDTTEKPAFAAFKQQMPSYNANIFLDTPALANNSKAFWHLAAPIDLMPF